MCDWVKIQMPFIRRSTNEVDLRLKQGWWLTPHSQRDVPLKVPVGEGGDVAGVRALVGLLRAGDEQCWVQRGLLALEPHPARVTSKLWATEMK